MKQITVIFLILSFIAFVACKETKPKDTEEIDIATALSSVMDGYEVTKGFGEPEDDDFIIVHNDDIVWRYKTAYLAQ